MQPLDSVAQREREGLRAQMGQLVSKINGLNTSYIRCLEAASLLDPPRAEQDSPEQLLEGEIKRFFEEVRAQLAQREQELINLARGLVEDKRKQLERQKESLQQFLVEAYGTFEQVNRAASECDELAAISHTRRCRQQLDSLVTKDIALSRVNPHVSVTFPARFGHAIATLGTVNDGDLSAAATSAATRPATAAPEPQPLIFTRCSNKIRITHGGRSIIKHGPGGWDANAQCSLPPTIDGKASYSVLVGSGCEYVMIGWAPASFRLESAQYKTCGCFLYTYGGSRVGQFTASSSTAYLGVIPKGTVVTSTYDRTRGVVSYALNDGPEADIFIHVSGELYPSFCLCTSKASLTLLS